MTVPPSPLYERLTPSRYRAAMSIIPTSVVVAATILDGEPIGMVIGTFSSVSMQPPLVGFFGDRRSSTLEPLLRGEHLSFGLLRQEDLAVCEDFRLPRDQRFSKLDWTVSEYGTPELASALLTVHARPYRLSDAGDHTCVLAEVLDVRQHTGSKRPLVFFKHRLSRLDPGHMLDDEMWQLGWSE